MVICLKCFAILCRRSDYITFRLPTFFMKELTRSVTDTLGADLNVAAKYNERKKVKCGDFSCNCFRKYSVYGFYHDPMTLCSTECALKVNVETANKAKHELIYFLVT